MGLGVVVALALTGSSEGPTLTEARLDDEVRTQTVTDLDDQSGSGGGAASDAEGGAGARTETVTDVEDDPDDPNQPSDPAAADLSGFLALDDASDCVWLVNVSDENPAKLFLISWPSGTELEWDPFVATIPTATGIVELDATEPFQFAGFVRDAIGDLSETEIERLVGLERCGHDGIVVIDDAIVLAR